MNEEVEEGVVKVKDTRWGRILGL